MFPLSRLLFFCFGFWILVKQNKPLNAIWTIRRAFNSLQLKLACFQSDLVLLLALLMSGAAEFSDLDGWITPRSE